jgi:cell division septal protein FtsQ
VKRVVVFAFLAGLGAATAALLSRVPEVLRSVEAFHVREVRVEGTRFLSRTEAIRFLSLPPGTSVWDDLEPLEERLETHTLVEDVRIRRRLPSTLLLEVEEEEPVALVATPALEPVDEVGRLLPIDPAWHRLDLPLLLPPGGEAGVLGPAERKLLAGEMAKLARTDPAFLARISDATLGRNGKVRVRIWDRDRREGSMVTVHFSPGLSSRRTQEGLRVLGDARARFGEARVVALDLRYDDQVVVRLDRSTGE